MFREEHELERPAGFEPAASPLEGGRSSAELRAQTQYPSLNHPEPLRTKPPPDEIMRLADILLHFGHFFAGLSVMACSSWNSCLHESHI